jgi:hypothetical protein
MAEMRHVNVNPFTEPEKYQAWVALSAFRLFIDEEAGITVKADSEFEAKEYAIDFFHDVLKMHKAMAEILDMEAKID